MLTSIQSTGVAPEVNIRNSLHAGDKTSKQGIHPGFETQGRHCQKSKTGVSVAPRKGLTSSKNFKKKEIAVWLFCESSTGYGPEIRLCEANCCKQTHQTELLPFVCKTIDHVDGTPTGSLFFPFIQSLCCVKEKHLFHWMKYDRSNGACNLCE